MLMARTQNRNAVCELRVPSYEKAGLRFDLLVSSS